MPKRARVWEYESENYINGSPALTDGRTMFGGCDALLHVIDITKGEREKVIDANSYIIGGVAADAGRVCGASHNEFLCIDLKAGKIVWNYKDRLFHSSSPALTKDRVLFGGQDKRLHCLRRDSGEAVWTFATRAGNLVSWWCATVKCWWVPMMAALHGFADQGKHCGAMKRMTRSLRRRRLVEK